MATATDQTRSSTSSSSTRNSDVKAPEFPNQIKMPPDSNARWDEELGSIVEAFQKQDFLKSEERGVGSSEDDERSGETEGKNPTEADGSGPATTPLFTLANPTNVFISNAAHETPAPANIDTPLAFANKANGLMFKTTSEIGAASSNPSKKVYTPQEVDATITKLEAVLRVRELDRREILGHSGLESVRTASRIEALRSFSQSVDNEVGLQIAEANEISKSFPVQKVDYSSPFFEIRPSEGKGLGAFALMPIKAGTYILREAPALRRPQVFRTGGEGWTGYLAVDAQMAVMLEEKRKKIMGLYKRCQCNKTMCAESEINKIFNANAFACPVPGSESEVSIHVAGSRFNHSCQPNTSWNHTEDSHILFRARRDINAGEEITASYMDWGVDRETRQKTLFESFGFHCNCISCVQDDDLTDPALWSEFALSPEKMREFNKMPKHAVISVIGEPSLQERAALLAIKLWVWKTTPKLLLNFKGFEDVVHKVMLREVLNENRVAVGRSTLEGHLSDVLAANNMFGLSEEVIKQTSVRVASRHTKDLLAQCRKIEGITNQI